MSLHTVSKEVGTSVQLIDDIYGRPTRTRHRSQVVEYREGEIIGKIDRGQSAS